MSLLNILERVSRGYSERTAASNFKIGILGGFSKDLEVKGGSSLLELCTIIE